MRRYVRLFPGPRADLPALSALNSVKSVKSVKKLRMLRGWFWIVVSDSLAFSASIAPFFVPKDPLGSDFKPKQNFKNKFENLSKTR